MILILSKHDFELTTEDVIDWLECLGGKWIRLNGGRLVLEKFAPIQQRASSTSQLSPLKTLTWSPIQGLRFFCLAFIFELQEYKVESVLANRLFDNSDFEFFFGFASNRFFKISASGRR